MVPKKFGMSLETQGIKLFWRDIPGFPRDIPEVPEKFEKKKFVFNFWPLIIRKAPDTFNFLRHVMRAIWSVRPKCAHRCVSLKETSFKPVLILKHTTKNSAEQTAMRTKWFKHIAIETVQAHLLNKHGGTLENVNLAS